MYIYDDPTCYPALPTPAAPGTAGYFTDGIPGVVPRTLLRGDFMNMLMMELVNLIGYANVAGAGITLSKTTYTQVYQAIAWLISSAIGGGSLVFSTGDAKMTYKTAADPGWIIANDGSIGSASSGATTLADPSAAALFTLLWNNTTNTACPVSGGRGANAAADFAANKTLTIPQMLGRALVGAGAGGGLTSRALAGTFGEENHTLTLPESPTHTHGLFLNPGSGPQSAAGIPLLAFKSSFGPNAPSGGGNWQGASLTMDAQGGGGAHNNMQPSTFLNVMIKL